MENIIAQKAAPVIMSTDFIKEKMILDIAEEEDLNVSEMQKLLKVGDIENSPVLSLNLEHQNLLNLSSLWKFSLLTKLELANNFIEEIESLENLYNLQFLDLSFNCIKTIKCLNDLRNLLYLNLSYNEITVLENMESTTKLETFIVRHNKIQLFDNIFYLKQFTTLLCLGVEGNPFTKQEDIRKRIVAILPQLRFLDFQIVTENEVDLTGFKYLNKECNADTSKDTKIENVNYCSLFTTDTPDKEAFVESLANGQGLETLLKCDKNFRALLSFPPVANIAEHHCKEVNKVFDKWHDKGIEYYKKMQNEKIEFTEMVKRVQTFSATLMEKECQKYIYFKEKIPKKLCSIYQKYISSEQTDVLAELKRKCDKSLFHTHKNLMNMSSFSIDLIYSLWKTFETEICSITHNYQQEVQEFYDTIMEIDESCVSQLKDFYTHIFNTGSNFNLEFPSQSNKDIQLQSVFLQLLSKREYVEMALKMSMTIHSTLLQERIGKLKTSLKSLKENTKKEVIKEDALVKENEIARDIVIFFSKQKYVMEKLFSNHEVHKRYLGYL